MPRRTVLLILIMVAAVAACVGFVVLHPYLRNVVARRGMSIWVAVEPHDSRLSPSMQVALRDHIPEAIAGEFQWAQRADGLETAEMPVLADGHEVDRVLLVRVDPGKYRFEIRNAPAGHSNASAWMSELHAVVVTNGSYFTRSNTHRRPC